MENINTSEAPAPNVTPNSNLPVGVKKNVTGKILSIIGASTGLVVVLLVIGFGAILSSRAFDPTWNPFRPNPDKVIGAAISNIWNIDQFHTDSTVDYRVSSGGQNIASSFSFAGDADISNLNNPSISGKTTLRLPGNGEGAVFSVDVTLVDKDVYFNVISASSNYQAFSPILLDALLKTKGGWIKYPALGIGELEEKYQSPNINAIWATIKKTFAENKIYTFKKKLPDQVLDGQKIYHYLVAVDNNALSKAIARILDDSGLLGAFTSKEQALAEFLNSVGEITIDVGIGSHDNYLYNLAMEKKVDISIFNPYYQGIADLHISINNSRPNEPVTIMPPPVYKNFEQIFLIP